VGGEARGAVKRAGLLMAAALVLTPVLAGAQGEDGSLTVDFQGVSRREGVVLFALFDSKAAYDANTGPVRTLSLPASGGGVWGGGEGAMRERDVGKWMQDGGAERRRS